MLEDITATCRRAVHAAGHPLDPPEIVLRLVEAGHEVVRTDHHRLVLVAVSSVAQLQAPPRGLNVVYGVCHEIGHLVVAQQCRPHALPPVVWDEAIAHLLATDVFLPAIDPCEMHARWPGGRPDFPACELIDPDDDEGYFRLLAHQCAQLREVCGPGPAGTDALLRAVSATAERRTAATDWFRRFAHHVRATRAGASHA